MRLAGLVVLVTLALILLAAPLVAPGERAPRLPRVGVVYAHRMPAETWRSLPVVKAALEGLEELQWVEGRDFVLDVRPATDFTHAQRRLASFVAEKVDALLFLGCNTEFHMARRLTHSIPIVVGSCVDDLIVTSIAPPGGNITGMSLLTPQMSAARLFLLKEIVPTLSRVTVLWSSERDLRQDWRELHAAAASIAVTLHSLEVRSRQDVLAHVLAREGADGLLGFPDGTYYLFAQHIADLSVKARLPGIYAYREIPEAGGLMSYGPNVLQLYRQAGRLIAKILAGASPVDLPVEQPNKFELVINLKTAKALGLTIPPSVLARADEIIQ